MWFITLIIFIFILGIIVLVHEFGHFIWAKKFGVYIYEFSIGMGPVIFSRKGKKDDITYNIRALPIGGFVSMAGEVYEDDDKVPKEKCLCNKPVWQRVIVMAAGVVNNFILAIVLLFVMALIWGSYSLTPEITSVIEGYPVSETNIVEGDVITAINNHKVSTWDEAQILLYYKRANDYTLFTIRHKDGTEEDYKITPIVETGDDGTETLVYGIRINQSETTGIWNKIVYTFQKFWTTIVSMWLTIVGLCTGKIDLSALSGPVGIYEVVGMGISSNLSSTIYYLIFILSYLSINVGVLNIIPFPAFDGGRIFFLIIEKIKGSPVNQKFENACHAVGFILLMLLIVIITIKDVINLF